MHMEIKKKNSKQDLREEEKQKKQRKCRIYSGKHSHKVMNDTLR